jgi:putative phosphoribosyl transferase
MRDDEVLVTGAELPGRLVVPDGATGLVVFAHGSDSSRHSPRNAYVADLLNRAGLATLLFDLLTTAEAADRRNVFDIPLLAGRLTAAYDWAGAELAGLPVGYFGASTGGAAALWSAADRPVAAVVSRGGRIDLAGPRLAEVTAPTLLIVGERDLDVLRFNQQAARGLTAEHRLEVVAGAGHLFEEPGTLDQVAVLARDWFASS